MTAILSLDPAQNNVGWAVLVLDGTVRHVETGTIRIKTEYDGVPGWMDLQRKLAHAIDEVLIRFSPDTVVSEYPHGGQSFAAARGLFATSGIVTGLTKAHNIPLEFVTEYDVKKVLFGRSKGVSKEEMMHKVLGIFAEFSYIVESPKVSKYQHEADALGVMAWYLRKIKVI